MQFHAAGPAEFSNVNRNDFITDFNLTGKIKNHFKEEAGEDVRTNHMRRFNALLQRYKDLKDIVLPLNASIDPYFKSDTAAVYHYFKHSDFGNEKLTPEQYFEIASQLVNEPLNRRSEQLNQQGNMNMITFTDTTSGALGIVFETLADGKQSIATIFYDEKVIRPTE